MSVDSFIPAMWAGNLLVPHQKALVYAQEGVINRDYEGEIAEQGDSVTINTLADPSIDSHTRNEALGTPEFMTTTEQSLIVDQAKRFHFLIDDIDKRQAAGDFATRALERAGYKLADTTDQYVAALMAAAVPSANQIGSTASPKTDLGTAGKAYDYLVKLGTKLDEQNVPSEGRWCIIPPWYHELLRLSGEDFIHATPGGDQVLRNGVIGEVAGFMVLKSNNVVNTSATKYKIIAGTAFATTFADQILKVQAYVSQSYFGDIVRGLHVYGGKVVYPNDLAMLTANKPS
jgi:N4-gp56 family major capsid protein